MAITIKTKSKKPSFYWVIIALQEQVDKYGSWEYLSEPDKRDSMLAGVILPDDPSEDPRDYFDFSGWVHSEETLENLKTAPLLQSFAPKKAINMQKRLIEKFPKVKHV